MPAFAVLFPGQGSQYVGMVQDVYAASPAARALIDEADSIAAQGELKPLMFAGPAERLTDTVNAQPALFAASLACWAALREALGDGASLARPAFVAGHSLGEYSALAAAGTFTYRAGLELVAERGRAMRAAGEARPGMMAAVLGMGVEAVENACAEATAQTGQAVVVANDNAPGQVVISGTSEGVRAAADLARTRGAKRVVPLAVSIAAHSPLMEQARILFAPALQRTSMQTPAIPVIGNREARPLADAGAVAAELDAQLVSPVRWTATILYLAEQGITTFVEVGPRDVLTGLGKRIAPAATFVPCGTAAEVQQVARLLRERAAS